MHFLISLIEKVVVFVSLDKTNTKILDMFQQYVFEIS